MTKHNVSEHVEKRVEHLSDLFLTQHSIAFESFQNYWRVNLFIVTIMELMYCEHSKRITKQLFNSFPV